MSSFLQEYQRQPKLFIDLPSRGKWYNDTIIKDANYEQLPVFGMNAMDEIMFKTPDSLYSGESTAEVVRSCIPSILDPWQLVGYDIDYILIAIRIATYGDSMPAETICPFCASRAENEISLTKMLGGFTNYETDFTFDLNDFTFHLSPITYTANTKFSLEQYQNERAMFQIDKLTDQEMDFKDKDKELKKLYAIGSDINVRMAISYVTSVSRNGQTETDLAAISSFITENDAQFFQELKEKISELTYKWNLPLINVTCPGEECGKAYKSAINVDYSSFFGTRFLRSRNLILSN
jgi:hypothetical protein